MADKDKLVKAGVEAALKPFADLLDKLAGPAAEEIGLTLKDHVRVFRLKRQVRLFERVKEMLAESNTEPGRVPFKVLLPIVENASIEENDEVQDMWAGLLANSASGEKVYPSYVELLKQLSPHEALLLHMVVESIVLAPQSEHWLYWKKIDSVVEEWKRKVNIDRNEGFADQVSI